MRVAIMQPYFMPYLGYLSLIKHTDHFVLFDTVQFIRHGWIERNRILKPAEGWQYIGVPMQKHSRDTLIKDTLIRTSEDWRDKIYRQLNHYKKAPHYNAVCELLNRAFSIETESITKLNEQCLKALFDYLELPISVSVFSEMDLGPIHAAEPGDWALHISKAMGASTYINPIGGRELFDVEKYKREGVEIRFMSNNLVPYSQRRTVFEPGLSIIDVLMFNDKEQTRQQLDQIVYHN